MPKSSHQTKSLTVSQVNQTIAQALDDAFPNPFWVTGEIQGYDRDAFKAASRRWRQIYFELIEKEEGKDTARASVKAISWGDAHAAILDKLRHASSDLKLQDGIQVRFLCAVDFYWPRASLQLKVLDVDPNFTLGEMERARQELIQHLKEEGLFDQNKKQSMPLVAQTIGLITSEGSAAFHDFMHELNGSGYAFHVQLTDARMQGEETERSVCQAIQKLDNHESIEAIVLIRGGGSRSDLIWFDKEKIAMAIAQCRKPVITGIGHEIDLSVADLVAHESRKTPTAAAQFLIQKAQRFETDLQQAGARIMAAVRDRIDREKHHLSQDVRTWKQGAVILIQRFLSGLSQNQQSLLQGAQRHLDVQKERLRGFLRECQLKDPLTVLARGYSLVYSNGELIKSVKHVSVGQELSAQFHDGRINAKVIKEMGKQK